MLAAWSGSFGIAFSHSILCASSPIKAGFGYDSIRLHPALLTWLQGIIYEYVVPCSDFQMVLLHGSILCQQKFS